MKRNKQNVSWANVAKSHSRGRNSSKRKSADDEENEYSWPGLDKSGTKKLQRFERETDKYSTKKKSSVELEKTKTTNNSSILSKKSRFLKEAGKAKNTRRDTMASMPETNPCHVVCIKKAILRNEGFHDLEHWLENSNHEYIGRNMEYYVPGARHSKWSNPFSVKKYGLDECLRLYREWVVSGTNPVSNKTRADGPLINDIEELRGKVLGCWCKPNPCHGDILTNLLSERLSQCVEVEE